VGNGPPVGHFGKGRCSLSHLSIKTLGLILGWNKQVEFMYYGTMKLKNSIMRTIFYFIEESSYRK
jgi:hypothetical protein